MQVTQLLSDVLFGSIKIVGCLLFSYLFYWRVIDYAHCVWFYGRQGRNVTALTPGHLPLIGNLFNVIHSIVKSYRDGDNYHICKHIFDSNVYGEDLSTAILFITNGAGLSICDPEVV